jgi:hypothetical protein
MKLSRDSWLCLQRPILLGLTACGFMTCGPLLAESDSKVLLVPVTAFSNMEHGSQLTNKGYVALLKSDEGQVIMAGPMSIEAAVTGKKLDSSPGATAPTILLKIKATYTDPKKGGTSGAEPQNGELSICLVDDSKIPVQNTTCRNLTSNVPKTHDDRNFQLIKIPVTYHLDGQNIRIDRYNTDAATLGREGSPTAIAVSLLHPTYQFLVPGKTYKDNQSPLVLDLECQNDLDLINVWDAHFGVKFDIEGDGVPNLTGWAGPKSGLLALDRNGDGRINDGRELFSEFSYGYALETGAHKRFTDGFSALSQYDANDDGKIDDQDPVFGYLRVWIDKNSNGKSESSELFTLKNLGIKSIDLDFRQNMVDGRYVIQADNEVRLVSSLTRTDGKICTVADVWFKQRRHPEIK